MFKFESSKSGPFVGRKVHVTVFLLYTCSAVFHVASRTLVLALAPLAICESAIAIIIYHT